MRRTCGGMRSPSSLMFAVASLLLVLVTSSSLASDHNIETDRSTSEQSACDAYGPQTSDCLQGPPGSSTHSQPGEERGCHNIYGPQRKSCSLGSSKASKEETCSHQFFQVQYGEQAVAYCRSILLSQEGARSNQHRIWEDPRKSASGTCHFSKKDQIANCLALLSESMNCASDRKFKNFEELVSSARRSDTCPSSLVSWIQESIFSNVSTTCGVGYPKGFYFDADSEMWLDVDECRENTSGCAHECENTVGSFRCKCRAGYELQEDQKSCVDIDECYLNVSGCPQDCENTDGSFRCKCFPGYSLMSDKKSCEDIDECRRNISGCSHRCVNTIGSYKCKCRRGFFLMEDKKSCDDHDECAIDKYGKRYAPCTHNCINVPLGFMCGCPKGFVINMRNPATCIDVRNVVAPSRGVEHKTQRK